MTMKDKIFMNVVYMYIHYQRTENERLAHNQVNIPTIVMNKRQRARFLFHGLLIVGMTFSKLIILIIYNAY